MRLAVQLADRPRQACKAGISSGMSVQSAPCPTLVLQVHRCHASQADCMISGSRSYQGPRTRQCWGICRGQSWCANARKAPRSHLNAQLQVMLMHFRHLLGGQASQHVRVCQKHIDHDVHRMLVAPLQTELFSHLWVYSGSRCQQMWHAAGQEPCFKRSAQPPLLYTSKVPQNA